MAFIAFGIVGFFAALGDELATPTIIAVEVVVAIGVGIQVLSILLARARGRRCGDASATSPARRSASCWQRA